MKRASWVAGLMLGCVMAGVPSVFAQDRSIEELPKDLLRWSTLWVAIPQQMGRVGAEEGPLSAMTWGMARGTATLIQATTNEVWDVVKPDEKPSHRPQRDDDASGVMLRYRF